jgi:hypothetical protein
VIGGFSLLLIDDDIFGNHNLDGVILDDLHLSSTVKATATFGCIG